MRILNGLLAAAGLAATLTANAQTFDFTETFSGSLQIFDSPFFLRSEANTLTPGGSNLPPSLASTSYSALFSAPFTGTFPVTGTFFGGNADTYTGTMSVESYVQRVSSNTWDISGSFVYTGGSGVYAGITGGGTMSGFDTYASTATGTTSRLLTGTYTVPIPEPSTYAMLLGGLALLGFVTRRRLR